MHKVAITMFSIGLAGLVFSALFTISSVDGLLEEVDDTVLEGDVVWEGRSPATFEGELVRTSIYAVLIEDGRYVDVELIGDDGEMNTFTPCEERCSSYENEFVDSGYKLAATVIASDGGIWKIRFSGDVVGDSDLRIKELEMPLFIDSSVKILYGGAGCCLSIVVLFAGAIVGFSSKRERVQQVEWVAASGGN